jgi:thioredoxin 1
VDTTYVDREITREEVDASVGPVVLEFGTDWCGHCQAAQGPLAEALAHFDYVRHLKIEDGRGRKLGRSFQVKLWPTFIFLLDGVEVARVVRPRTADAIRAGLAHFED